MGSIADYGAASGIGIQRYAHANLHLSVPLAIDFFYAAKYSWFQAFYG